MDLADVALKRNPENDPSESVPNQYVCPECEGCTFSARKQLENHFRTEHRDREIAMLDQVQPNQPQQLTM